MENIVEEAAGEQADVGEADVEDMLEEADIEDVVVEQAIVEKVEEIVVEDHNVNVILPRFPPPAPRFTPRVECFFCNFE